MITLQSITEFTAGVSVGALGFHLIESLRRKIILRAAHRNAKCVLDNNARFRGRLVRHSPTGRVGSVVGAGVVPHPYFGAIGAKHYVALALDKESARLCQESVHESTRLSIAEALYVAPVSEIAPALPEEIADFHS